MEHNVILQKLESIELLISEQTLLQKQVYNFKEACKYADLSESHMYKLTSTRQVPHSCPQGKRLYFLRTDLDEWLLRNRKSSTTEVESAAMDFVIKSKKSRT